jgi:hypothetical protein
MEPPSKVDGTGSGESIRDAKVQALSAIPPITLDDCFLGQYEGKLNIIIRLHSFLLIFH